MSLIERPMTEGQGGMVLALEMETLASILSSIVVYLGVRTPYNETRYIFDLMIVSAWP
jgi:hypothetical protein